MAFYYAVSSYDQSVITLQFRRDDNHGRSDSTICLAFSSNVYFSNIIMVTSSSLPEDRA